MVSDETYQRDLGGAVQRKTGFNSAEVTAYALSISSPATRNPKKMKLCWVKDGTILELPGQKDASRTSRAVPGIVSHLRVDQIWNGCIDYFRGQRRAGCRE